MSLSTQEYTWVPVNCQGSVMKWMGGGGEGGKRLQDRLLLNGPHYLKTDLDNRGRICKQCLIVDLWIEVCSTQYWLGSIFLSWTLQTPDFYVEMKWEFTSWGKNFFIAVFSCTVTKSYFDLECLSVKKLCSAAKLHYTCPIHVNAVWFLIIIWLRYRFCWVALRELSCFSSNDLVDRR